MIDSIPSRTRYPGRLAAAAIPLALALWTGPAAALDLCGCAGSPSLGDFDSADAASHPPNTQVSDTSYSSTITIELPPDGVLVFDSFRVDGNPNDRTTTKVEFAPNAANAPVTLLVKGDLSVAANNTISVDGLAGNHGSSATDKGAGGRGGPGGFRGGDGAYRLVNFQSDGGAGLGPGGGAGATVSPAANAQAGQFVGIEELLPMIGGSGGGGGRSSTEGATCVGGGGGGGGGALLIAVNGSVTLDGTLSANGGSYGTYGGYSCSTRGAAGSGGAVRIIATGIAGSGTINAVNGAIRLEAFDNGLPAASTNPVASRAPAPGPVVNPVSAGVAITAVAGETVSLANGEPLAERPQGSFGLVDVALPAPGTVAVDLATTGVPDNTTVTVTAKPNPGGPPATETATLEPGNCDANGVCTAQVTFDLTAGRHVIEAQATFQTP